MLIHSLLGLTDANITILFSLPKLFVFFCLLKLYNNLVLSILLKNIDNF